MNCCNQLQSKITIFKKTGEEGDQILAIYYPESRMYGIVSPRQYPSQYQIYHCPWCGAKFPRSLEKEWSDMVDEVLQPDEGDAFGSDEYNKLPEKYRTEQWWRELGL
jgi:hypothetical protein